jgi:serine phosphatase RsbU (regulator of sigma subunit)
LEQTLRLVETQRTKITDSIRYAQRIQEATLPSTQRLARLFQEHFVIFRPKDVVSGDFYWVSDLDEDTTVLAIVDCTGHGVPGAFMSMVGTNLLGYIVDVQGKRDAAEILNCMHKDVRRTLNQSENKIQDGMDMSVVVWHRKEHTLQFAGAKTQLVYIKDDDQHVIKGNKTPIGGEQHEQERVFHNHLIQLDSPITFYLFSDGYSDQMGGEEGRKYMIKRFRQLLFDTHHHPIAEQKKILTQELEDWMDTKQQMDDIMVFGARIS